MSKKIKREIVYHTDDEQDAINELGARYAKGERDLTYAKVQQMLDPPETAYKFIVFRIIED